MEEGELADSLGRTVSFRSTVVILTSNLGTEKLSGKGSIGFLKTESDLAGEAEKSVRDFFSPELLGRLDDIIVFDELTDEQLSEIAHIMLSALKDRADNLGIELEFDDSAIEKLAVKGKGGARELRRQITENVENLLSRKLLSGEIRRGDHLLLSFNGNSFSVTETVAANY